MSDMFSGDITNADSLQMSEIFGFMNPEYHETVVKRALDSRDKVSKEARGSLNSAINSTVKVPQFPKEPARAPTPYLMEQILKAVTQSDELAGAVLKVWAESHDALGTVVVKHLEDLAMPTECPDFSGNRFQGTWFSDVWTHETDKILERHGEFDKDDIALMLCYVSGKIPGSRETKDDVLSQGLEYLRSLPPNAPQWEQMIPEFVKSIQDVIETKKAQYKQAYDLDTLIAEVWDIFSSELEFFQRDIASWSAAHLLPDADLSKVLRDIQGLRSLLTEYQSIYKPAPVLEKERERRPRRAKLENRILPIIDRIDRLINESPAPPIEQEQQSDVPAAQQLVHEPYNQHTFSEADYIALKSVHEKEIEVLQSQLHEHQGEIEKLQKETERWRRHYIEEASKEAATTGEDEDLVIESVNNAVELAKERFGNKLLFQLNGKSRVKDNPFIHPKAVWDALQWLATTYYGARMGKNSLTSPDVSIRKVCKWWYKGHQSDITMNKYKDWYTTKVGNKVHTLQKHIGTGSSRNARYTIRIAFDWDKSKERVVIGFIGQHQQTDAT
ncbi:MAG: hypothetical protein F4W91_01115 [Gemmatimonadetes bacterium]|nr:hypothetical protein [Gemmatimonadota bacterium]